MAEGCPAKCAKFFLIAFNIVFWLSGAVLLGVGIWLLVDDKILKFLNIVHVDNQDNWFKIAAYVIVAVGAFTFVTGFAGCCGAIRESPCLLGVYIFLLVIIMLIEITAGVLAFIYRNNIETEVTNEMSKTFMEQNYTAGFSDNALKYSGFGTSMNLFQQQFECCGVNGSADYSVVKDISNFDDKIPYACCKLVTADQRAAPQKKDVQGQKCDSNDAFNEGCEGKLKTWLHKQALILIGLGIGIACLEIFGIIFAVCVCRNPTSEKYE